MDYRLFGTGITAEYRLEPSSRRAFLQAAAGAAAILGTTAGAVSAQMKVSQAAAAYQDHPNGANRCAGCSHFAQPNKCQLVTGTVSPDGWCRLFAPLSGRSAATPAGSRTSPA